MRGLLNSPEFYRQVRAALHLLHGLPELEAYGTERFPLPNVWVGVSVENQQWADIRIPALLDTPAAVRFLSCEPLLGPVDLAAVPTPACTCGQPPVQLTGTAMTSIAVHWVGCAALRYRWPDWAIAGGESGRGARPMQADWARSLRDQCSALDIPFFMKQAGTVLAKEWGARGKGEDPTEWPEPLPQEYPRGDG